MKDRPRDFWICIADPQNMRAYASDPKWLDSFAKVHVVEKVYYDILKVENEILLSKKSQYETILLETIKMRDAYKKELDALKNTDSKVGVSQ